MEEDAAPAESKPAEIPRFNDFTGVFKPFRQPLAGCAARRADRIRPFETARVTLSPFVEPIRPGSLDSVARPPARNALGVANFG